MARGITPAKTLYKGVLFRSRLEARWAVFLDSLGVSWLYEPMVFRLGRGVGVYLPDFWLYRTGWWVEVKPPGYDHEGAMLGIMCARKKAQGLLVCGDPWPAGYRVGAYGPGLPDVAARGRLPYVFALDDREGVWLEDPSGAAGRIYLGNPWDVAETIVTDIAHPRLTEAYKDAKDAVFSENGMARRRRRIYLKESLSDS